jgi:putative FmdB family regulatory protein
MPSYDYACNDCDREYEIYKSIKEYDGKDPCPFCGLVGRRLLSANISFLGEKVESPEYNVGLGKVVRNSKHRAELAKSMNLVEIGNENPETFHNKFEKERESKRLKSYDDV